MNDGFEIKYDFVEKWGRFAKPEYLQVYLYILCCSKRDGSIPDTGTIAKRLHIEKEAAEAALDFWTTADILAETDGGYVFTDGASGDSKNAAKKTEKKQSASGRYRTRPSYDSAEIDAAASLNKNIDYMFRQAEKILDRLLSPSDYEMLYSFVDWLGLPVEVVIMLLNFAVSQGKTTKRYLETVAIDWADKGINTYESAEEYIKEIELKMSNEGKIRSILGIYDRALTQTEKKYIKLWTYEKDIPLELVNEAYDRTVSATGKLSWAYMNKILMSWDSEGIRNMEALKEHETLYKLKSGSVKEKITPKKSKFNNYTDTNKPDYSNFAEQILQDMLDEG